MDLSSQNQLVLMSRANILDRRDFVLVLKSLQQNSGAKFSNNINRIRINFIEQSRTGKKSQDDPNKMHVFVSIRRKKSYNPINERAEAKKYVKNNIYILIMIFNKRISLFIHRSSSIYFNFVYTSFRVGLFSQSMFSIYFTSGTNFYCPGLSWLGNLYYPFSILSKVLIKSQSLNGKYPKIHPNKEIPNDHISHNFPLYPPTIFYDNVYGAIKW